MANRKKSSTDDLIKEQIFSNDEEDVVVENKTTTVKRDIIIANEEVPMYKYPNKAIKYQVDTMKPGVSYYINDVFSNITGQYYQLNNNLYVAKNRNYTIIENK